MSRAKVADIVTFLVDRGLCQEVDGKISMGTTATYVDGKIPMVNSHRRNWRMKAMEKFTEKGPNDLFYASPYSLSLIDIETIHKEIAKLIGSISKRVGDSPAERLACLNVDFFEF